MAAGMRGWGSWPACRSMRPSTARRKTPRPLPMCARMTWTCSAMRRGRGWTAHAPPAAIGAPPPPPPSRGRGGGEAGGRPRGIVAQLSRAIVVGPIARLELIASHEHQPADDAPPGPLIEAQIPAQQFKDMGFSEGETLVVTPRRARIFLDGA